MKKTSSPFSPQKNINSDDQAPMAYALSRAAGQPLDPPLPLNPFEPFDPARRPPMPKRPFELSNLNDILLRMLL